MKTIKYTYIGKSGKNFTNGECYDVVEVGNNKYTTKDDMDEGHFLSEGFLLDNFGSVYFQSCLHARNARS